MGRRATAWCGSRFTSKVFFGVVVEAVTALDVADEVTRWKKRRDGAIVSVKETELYHK